MMLESLSPSAVALAGVAIALAAAIAGLAWGGRGLRKLAERNAVLEREVLEARDELASYRRRVADHFTGAAEKLQVLTLQYRSVYEHLARGASELCPDDFRPVAAGLDLERLPGAAEASAADPAKGAS
jgi:uncharacterized membrane-anchored protein YhcB (DUF1043 family)